MKRPDLQAALEPLKPFQQRTVEHAFHRLFEAPDSTSRFLVADEVGLGKTLVARGIIARAVDHLWDSVKRIDIIYICSNGSIARANLPKLQVSSGSQRSLAIATRLTMLATQLAPQDDKAGLADSKLNFVSFTPTTSFNMGHAAGAAPERVVLFRLLESLVPQRTALMNFLQGGVTSRNRWRSRLHHEQVPLDTDVRSLIEKEFHEREQLKADLDEFLETWCKRYRKHWPQDARWQRNRIIGELRKLVAQVCINALQPDLVIMDEFQRFKPLLEDRPEHQTPAAILAQSLFDAETPEGNPVRTLLLSATPYKLYTTDAEIDQEDHYEDFIATSRFLLKNDSNRVGQLQRDISIFGGALRRAAAGEAGGVEKAKSAVQSTLQAIMARTERVDASEAKDSMVEDASRNLSITPADVRQYVASEALFRSVGDRDPMTFWKSAPYLPHFMRGYRFNDRLAETCELSPEKVTKVLDSHRDAFLDRAALLEWQSVDLASAKLREIAHDLLDGGLWRLLWMPPTVPYWSLEGAYEDQECPTKTLLFSAWNVVPDVVSAVLSYETERRMMGGRLTSYEDPAKQQAPRLRFTHTGSGVRSRHRLMLLLLPCLTLADKAHPLSAPPGTDRRAWVRQRVEALLSEPSIPNMAEGDVDHRWEWAAPLVLDPSLRKFIETWQAGETDLPMPNPEILPEYLQDLLDIDTSSLGKRPDDLVDVLTEVALGSPGVLAARAVAAKGVDKDARRRNALRIAYAFWTLFNRPAVICLLDQLATADEKLSRDEGFYWRQVMRYCIAGNLQAVLDETWHLAWEQRGWATDSDKADVATECATDLANAIQPLPSRVHARFMEPVAGGAIDEQTLRIRTVIALRFGDTDSEERADNQDAVRAAFNSPFRPFVLTSTSVGQEGLDFHPWCHRIVHWDLPGNPVDLEQREGRVNRYKGHAVRRNVADSFAEEALSAWSQEDDLWGTLFELANNAAREQGANDLIPHWIADGNASVQRHVPLLPYSREVEAFKRLLRQLAAYRVVFGQPRQEELVTLLDNSELRDSQIRRWVIDLKPPVK